MKLSKIKHALAHPDRAIRWVLGGEKGKKKVVYSYITDYDKDEIPLKALSLFFDDDLKKYHEELLMNKQYLQLEKDIANNWKNMWLFGFTQARLLYVITRSIKPQIVIETGVASGLSSFIFLLAFSKNNRGHLYSIDLPQKDKDYLPSEKTIGWLVPDSMKDSWTLQLGDSKKILPNLLNELKECDLFLHDSDHSYEHMKWEFETVWPFLNQALLADDINTNNAFDDFAKKYDCSSIKNLERMGIMLPPNKKVHY